MNKYVKQVAILWVVNAIALISFVFLHHYTKHIGHWTKDAWYVLMVSSTIGKLFIAIALAIVWGIEVEKNKH